MMISKYFSQNQLKGLLKVGDIILPGTDTSPSFSTTGCITHIDRMAEFLSDDDLNGLCLLFGLFRWTPKWKIRLILKACHHNKYFPGFLGSALRMLEIGIKGATLSPYYANLTSPEYTGQKVYDVIGWNPKIVVHDEKDKIKPEKINLENPTPEDIRAVYDRAKKVQPDIREWGVKKRVEFISNLKAVILANQDRILDKVQADTGKSRFDAITAEIFGVLDFLDYLEKNAVKILSDRNVATPFALMGKKSKIYFEPLGTALLISPWNYPFYQAIVPICQAFIVGNAVVFKPSKATPLKGLVEDLLDQAGFFTGWVQIVYGQGGVIGDALVDGRPDKIFMIGSTAVGKRIMSRAAEHLIPVELELGGKDPMIVFEDVNINRAVAGAIWGAFTTTGQSCTSVERLFVHKDIYDQFKETLVRETLKLTLGTDSDGNTDIGAITTASQVKEIARQVADAKEKGAVFLTGKDWDGTTAFVQPMVIEGVTKDMLIDQLENFGPLLPLYSFSSEQEAVELANDPDYGLSASVWANDLKKADRVARQIYTGNVSINNVMLTEGNHALPFGGVQKSGFGRYKGEFGFYAFANIKSILIDKNSKKMEANWFPYTSKKYQLFSNLTKALYSPGKLSSYIMGAIHGLRLENYVGKLAKKGRPNKKK
ncbi:MAG: aldehyde dehydrogenase family protein [Proteobacteria bacterium]|nr:aldehyde dehydrogenase family protein [Pseudomonadota bacterium]MBU1583572.1 aldehyde dehydrogenase family protein [Pseudomonadota bacterium]MBU2453262.1 aldehyde dehydrogenase family protein [Pseudomonadota bacterium]